MNQLSNWPAPAKLNLFLHITGRRDDGYHNLQTVFQFLDFGDSLSFQLRSDNQLKLTPELPGVPNQQNLIIRAAELLCQFTSCKLGADIQLEKRLPSGGGLGGGSSDAATTLLALNHLWQLNLSIDQLAELGLQLGADVPVFVRMHAAWAEGVGEKLQPIELDEPWFIVLKPQVNISTADIFTDPDLVRNSPLITQQDFLNGVGHNDCQPVAEQRFPQVSEVIKWLAQFSSESNQPRMTGTGSCVFMKCETEQQAQQIIDRSPFTGFIARGLNNSPLAGKVRTLLAGAQ